MAKKPQDTLACAVIIEGVRHEADTRPPLKPHQRERLRRLGALKGVATGAADEHPGETSNG